MFKSLYNKKYLNARLKQKNNVRFVLFEKKSFFSNHGLTRSTFCTPYCRLAIKNMNRKVLGSWIPFYAC